MVNFMWFRLVCTLWLASSSTEKLCEHGKHVINHYCHPHQWILLMELVPKATPTHRKLLNITTWKIIKVDLTELAGHAVVLR